MKHLKIHALLLLCGALLLADAWSASLPTQVLKCRAFIVREPVPDSLMLEFEIIRRWEDKPMTSETVTESWSEARWEDMGSSELRIKLLDGTVLTEQGQDSSLRILDGRNGIRDEFIDDSKGSGQINVDDHVIDYFGFGFTDLEGARIDDHTAVPEAMQFELEPCASPPCVEDCWVYWRDLSSAPPFDSGSMRALVYEYTVEPSESSFRINAGLNDAWFNPATNGQGFFIIVFEDIPLVFLAWFTFDTERPPEDVMAILGDPGQRWITAQGPFADDTATLDIVVTRGGVFDSGEPVPENTVEGSMQVVFESCTAGVVKYDLPEMGLFGEVPIQRIANDNVPLCEALSE